MSHVGRSREAQSLPSLDDGRPRANSVLQQVEAKVSIVAARLSPPTTLFSLLLAHPELQSSCSSLSCYRLPIFAGIRGLARDFLLLCLVVSLLFHSTTINTHARDVALTIALSCLSRQPLTDRFFRTTPILTSRVSLRPNSSTPARLV
jgi:hypothetical protein